MSTRTAERVASEVRAELARRRLSQARVAQAMNISQAALSRRLTGDVSFDLDDLERLASFLHVSVVELVALGASEPVAS